MKRLKVLMSAYACEPGKGSEPGIGWNTAREMARYHDVWLITRANNRLAIEAELAREPVPTLHFVYYDLPYWTRWWKRGSRGVQLYYTLWQASIYPVAQKLHEQLNFDLVHHVSFVKYWSPSFLALLKPPFVWGPVGGKEPAPLSFLKSYGGRGVLYEGLRNSATWFGDYDPFVKLTAQRSALALAASKETAAHLRRLGARNVRVLTPTAAPNDVVELFNGDAERANCSSALVLEPIRFISIGRLLHWKGFHLAIKALAKSGIDAEYWIVGDGAQQKRLEDLARAHGVEKQVQLFHINRQEMIDKLDKADVLLHPALHDAGPTVIVEAMAAGKPVICLNIGGPAVQVTEETGIKVPVNGVEKTVHDLAVAMKRIAQDRKLRCAMGRAGQQRVQQVFTWKARGEYLNRLYQEVASSHGQG